MTRRELLRYAALGTLGLLCSPAFAESAEWLQEQLRHFDGRDVFARIIDKSSAGNWNRLPIGELIGKIALEPEISKCLNWSSKLTGVMIARPLEVRNE